MIAPARHDMMILADRRLALVAVLVALFASGAARAQQAPTGGETIGRILDAVKLRAAPTPPADFVVNSRPERMDYAPLAPPPARTTPKTPADLDRLQAELAGAKARARARAARVKIPDAGAPPPERPTPRRGN